jgi:hypothetical protein
MEVTLRTGYSVGTHLRSGLNSIYKRIASCIQPKTGLSGTGGIREIS